MKRYFLLGLLNLWLGSSFGVASGDLFTEEVAWQLPSRCDQYALKSFQFEDINPSKLGNVNQNKNLCQLSEPEFTQLPTEMVRLFKQFGELTQKVTQTLNQRGLKDKKTDNTVQTLWPDGLIVVVSGKREREPKKAPLATSNPQDSNQRIILKVPHDWIGGRFSENEIVHELIHCMIRNKKSLFKGMYAFDGGALYGPDTGDGSYNGSKGYGSRTAFIEGMPELLAYLVLRNKKIYNTPFGANPEIFPVADLTEPFTFKQSFGALYSRKLYDNWLSLCEIYTGPNSPKHTWSDEFCAGVRRVHQYIYNDNGISTLPPEVTANLSMPFLPRYCQDPKGVITTWRICHPFLVGYVPLSFLIRLSEKLSIGDRVFTLFLQSFIQEPPDSVKQTYNCFHTGGVSSEKVSVPFYSKMFTKLLKQKLNRGDQSSFDSVDAQHGLSDNLLHFDEIEGGQVAQKMCQGI